MYGSDVNFDITQYDIGVWTDVKGKKYKTLKAFSVLVYIYIYMFNSQESLQRITK